MSSSEQILPRSNCTKRGDDPHEKALVNDRNKAEKKSHSLSDSSLPRSRFLDVITFGGTLRDIQKTAARETSQTVVEKTIVSRWKINGGSLEVHLNLEGD